MNTEMKLIPECKNCRSHMTDLLLESDYLSRHPELAAHLEACTSCSAELQDLHSTVALLDDFPAPAVSPFFDSRLHARLREAQAAEPEGFWERIRSYVTFSTGRSFRPALAGAMALVLAVGGASIVGVHGISTSSNQPGFSSTVNDLKVLDNNAQAEQQMDQLLDVSGAADEDVESNS